MQCAAVRIAFSEITYIKYIYKSSIKVTIDYAPSAVVMIIFIFVCIPDGHGPGRNLRIISRVEDSKGDIPHPDSTLLGLGHCFLHAAEQQAGDQGIH